MKMMYNFVLSKPTFGQFSRLHMFYSPDSAAAAFETRGVDGLDAAAETHGFDTS